MNSKKATWAEVFAVMGLSVAVLIFVVFLLSYGGQEQGSCPAKPMKVESELGIIKDFEVYQLTAEGMRGCNITYENGIKTVNEGQICRVLTTGKMLVSYGRRCEQGYVVYGTVDVNKEAVK